MPTRFGRCHIPVCPAPPVIKTSPSPKKIASYPPSRKEQHIDEYRLVFNVRQPAAQKHGVLHETEHWLVINNQEATNNKGAPTAHCQRESSPMIFTKNYGKAGSL
jgi:hypothetical protein